jgi:hypothetical protein
MARGLLIAVVAVANAALAFAAPAHAGGPTMLIGAAEDLVKQADPVKAKAELDLAKLGGLDAIRITQVWAPDQTQPTAASLKVDRTVVGAAQLDGIRIFVSIFNFGSRTTPLSSDDQDDFAAYAGALAKALPGVTDFIVGNEPNLNRYWLPQFGPKGEDVAAPAYEQLLAQTYDAIKQAAPTAKVWGGALAPRGIDKPNTGRDTHSPTAFIQDLGAAYKASGRAEPIMDGFAFHPYGDSSSTPPDFQHPTSSSIGLGDYGKLTALLDAAFSPGLPIVYDEYGVETTVPAAKAKLYAGAEAVTTKPVDEATQADYYRQAIQIAFCQPRVAGLFLFHTVDEPGLAQWQSGLYYVDDTPRLSRNVVAVAAGQARRGVVVGCPGLQLHVKATVDADGVLRCDLDCTYVARLQKLPKRSTTFVARGSATGGIPKTIAFRRAASGRYRISVVVTARMNAGARTTAVSPAFAT